MKIDRPGDTSVQAQHEETGRFWYGQLKDLPKGYYVFNSESWQEYDRRHARPAPQPDASDTP